MYERTYFYRVDLGAGGRDCPGAGVAGGPVAGGYGPGAQSHLPYRHSSAGAEYHDLRRIGVGVGVGVAVGVGVGVGVAVGFTVGVGVAVGFTVGVAVDVGLGVGVSAGISVGSGVIIGSHISSYTRILPAHFQRPDERFI